MSTTNILKPKIIIESSKEQRVGQRSSSALSTPFEKNMFSTYSYSNPISNMRSSTHNEYKYNWTKYVNSSQIPHVDEYIKTFEGPNTTYYYETIPLKTNTNNIFEITPSQEELSRISYNPKIEIYSTCDFAVLMMDIPGVCKENLKVELEKGLLKIYGNKYKPHIEELEKRNEYHTKIIERLNEYFFCKIFQMPPAFSEGQNISCKLNDGELVVKILANELKTQKKVIDVQS
ncbi:HSP20-like chaperone [Plasmodium sp. DRC-Itaito]|nr:HSP20-like chaperone [Plasmodium sp. DRC-Itaito]